MNPENSQAALAQLQQQQGSAQDPNSILAAQRQQLGVNSARDTTNGLRGSINATTKLLQQVAPSVMGRTAGSLVNSAQATKQVQNEQAPIAQNLQTQTGDYNQANEDLSRLESEASQAASGIYQGQQDKMSYLQNVYNTLFQREQSAEQAKQAEANRQEQVRQFNEQLALSKKSAGSGGGYDLSSLTGGADKPSVWVNKGAGNQFKDGGGKGITAYQYAQTNGVGYRDLLQQMANKGDKNASVALKYVGDNGIFGSAPRSVAAALEAVGARGNYV